MPRLYIVTRTYQIVSGVEQPADCAKDTTGSNWWNSSMQSATNGRSRTSQIIRRKW